MDGRIPEHPSNRLPNSLTEAGAEPPSGSRILDQDDRWMSRHRALKLGVTALAVAGLWRKHDEARKIVSVRIRVSRKYA